MGEAMTVEQLTDKIATYLMSDVASKVQSPMTKFAIGAACSSSGKHIMAQKLSSMLSVIADTNGDFSAESVKDMLTSGMKLSGKMPILGGLLIIDATDVAKFCEGL